VRRSRDPKSPGAEGKGMDGKGMKAAGFISQFPCRPFRCPFPPDCAARPKKHRKQRAIRTECSAGWQAGRAAPRSGRREREGGATGFAAFAIGNFASEIKRGVVAARRRLGAQERFTGTSDLSLRSMKRFTRAEQIAAVAAWRAPTAAYLFSSMKPGAFGQG